MNTPHDNISEELLARYLGETASEQEIAQVRSWLSSSPDNAREFEQFQTIWELSGAIGKQRKSVDTDLAWNKLQKKMKPNLAEIEQQDVTYDNDVIPLPVKKRSPFTLWAAAAVALLVMTFAWRELKKTPTQNLLSVTTTNHVKEMVLPDGTKVFLNFNSNLSYPENFNGDFRSVALTGEAFFEVKSDAEHPFVIDANGTQVKVLGTSFNVKAYTSEPVRVDVSTGKVAVRKAGKEINLTKGQSAEVVSDSIRSILPDVNLMGYRTQIYDFNGTPLQDVVASIRNGYHADVRLSGDHVSRCRLTIRFEKEPLDATLSVIAETMELKLRKDGQTYWLDGNGCP
jgi:transmembrane sensor